MLKTVLLFALALALGPAMADQPCTPFEGGRVDPGLLQIMREAASNGRLYRVDPQASKVGFCVRHFPGQEFRGEFTNIIGGLVFPPLSAQHGQALLLIRTASLSSENTTLLPLVTGQDFFDASHYPEILFVGHTAHWLNNTEGHIHGDLTLHGVTQPVTFSLALRPLEDGEEERPARILLQGRGQVQRTSFNMNSYRFFVSETVQLCLDVELVPWQ
ncbi:MAG: YceI family protein [Gammaproteobacteria bacterium]|jgi:polyisoprenoid-binding protein YceI|nr:YceI family protein [Gammaproteobacteria bacterium]